MITRGHREGGPTGFSKNFKTPFFNPISHKLWNDVITRGGAIMARMDSSHPEAVSRHSRAQN